MSSYGYGFCPQSPSYTAMKYMRTYIPHRALLPGERYRLHLDMEAKVRGYRDISRDMRDLSVEIDRRRRIMTSPDRELSPPCTFNNRAIGYTTSRDSGNQWRHEIVPSTVRYSVAPSSLVFGKGMNNTYRYYAMHRTRIG